MHRAKFHVTRAWDIERSCAVTGVSTLRDRTDIYRLIDVSWKPMKYRESSRNHAHCIRIGDTTHVKHEIQFSRYWFLPKKAHHSVSIIVIMLASFIECKGVCLRHHLLPPWRMAPGFLFGGRANTFLAGFSIPINLFGWFQKLTSKKEAVRGWAFSELFCSLMYKRTRVFIFVDLFWIF